MVKHTEVPDHNAYFNNGIKKEQTKKIRKRKIENYRGPYYHPFDDELMKRFRPEQLIMEPYYWNKYIKNPDIITGLSEEKIKRVKQLRRRALARRYSQGTRDRAKEKTQEPSKTPIVNHIEKRIKRLEKQVLILSSENDKLRSENDELRKKLKLGHK